MALTIPSTALPDPPNFQDFSLAANLIGGYFQITGNPARVELLYGRYGGEEKLPQVDLPTGSYSVGRSPSGRPLAGIRAQNAQAGLGSTLGGYFWTESDPTLSFIGVPSAGVVGAVLIPVVALADFPPTGPGDGSLIVLDLGTTRWLLEFDAAANNWQFAGGPPIVATVAAAETTGVGGAYQDLATLGPSITIPRDGSYLITCESRIASSSTQPAYMSYAVGAAAAIDDDSASASAGIGGSFETPSSTQVKACLAGDVILAKYRGTAGNQGTFAQRRLRVAPVTIT